eukprot:COSAG02_NODE_26452_length_632_cov_1.641651_2_plen_30_part_01
MYRRWRWTFNLVSSSSFGVCGLTVEVDRRS